MAAFLFLASLILPKSIQAKDHHSLFSAIALTIIEKIPLIKQEYKLDKENYLVVFEPAKAKAKLRNKKFPLYDVSLRPISLRASVWPSPDMKIWLKSSCRFNGKLSASAYMGISFFF